MSDNTHKTGWCTSCREHRPKVDFDCLENTNNAGKAPVVCKRCHETGPPPMDPNFGLKPWEKKALQHYFRSGNLRQAAKYAGVDEKALRVVLRAEQPSGMRHAFQYMLEQEGMDLFSLARTLKACFDATESKFNPETREYESFPDYRTRLQTTRTLVKIHELEAPRESKATQNPLQINFITNLGDETAPTEAPGTITVEVPQGE